MEAQSTRHRKKYTGKEKSIIRDGYRDKRPVKEIAEILGRDYRAVMQKAATLGCANKRASRKVINKLSTPPSPRKVGLIRRFNTFLVNK